MLVTQQFESTSMKPPSLKNITSRSQKFLEVEMGENNKKGSKNGRKGV